MNRKILEILITGLEIVSSIISIIAFIKQDFTIFILMFISMAILSVLLFEINKTKNQLKLVSLKVEDLNITSLNIGNINRLTNHTLDFTEIEHTYTVRDGDLDILQRCKGKVCKPDFENEIMFSICGDSNMSVEKADMWGFDLINDHNRSTKILPRIVENDGISKLVALPLLKPTELNQLFEAEFFSTIESCILSTKDYISAVASCSENENCKFSVNLIFENKNPKYVTSYRIIKGVPKLQCRLNVKILNNKYIYHDQIYLHKKDCFKIYIFEY